MVFLIVYSVIVTLLFIIVVVGICLCCYYYDWDQESGFARRSHESYMVTEDKSDMNGSFGNNFSGNNYSESPPPTPKQRLSPYFGAEKSTHVDDEEAQHQQDDGSESSHSSAAPPPPPPADSDASDHLDYEEYEIK